MFLSKFSGEMVALTDCYLTALRRFALTAGCGGGKSWKQRRMSATA